MMADTTEKAPALSPDEIALAKAEVAWRMSMALHGPSDTAERLRRWDVLQRLRAAMSGD